MRKHESLTDFSDFGDFTSVSFNCLKDLDETTDIMAIYELVKCESELSEKSNRHVSFYINSSFKRIQTGGIS